MFEITLDCVFLLFFGPENSLTVDGRTYKLNNNVYVVGFGKAVSGMARAVEDLIGQHIVKGVVSVPHGTKELFSSLGKE